MRVGELIVAVVGEREVARTAIVELLNAGNLVADRIAVFDAHQSDFFSLCVDSAYIGDIERQLDFVRCDLATEAMDRVKFLNRGLVGAFVARGFERIRILRFSRLADINTKEKSVEAASDHIRQVKLGLESLRVVSLAD